MAEQIRKQKTPSERRPGGSDEQLAGPGGQGRELVSAIDELLDEIDEVLESDATGFVASYVQRGGE